VTQLLVFYEYSINCPRCKLTVKKKENVCPHCQYHFSSEELEELTNKAQAKFIKSKRLGYIVGVLFFVFFLIIYLITDKLGPLD
jgi:predicted amidophosphoribosyltransferase